MVVNQAPREDRTLFIVFVLNLAWPGLCRQNHPYNTANTYGQKDRNNNSEAIGQTDNEKVCHEAFRNH